MVTLLVTAFAVQGVPAHAGESDKTLDEIIVGQKRDGGVKRPFLRDEVAPVESCTVEEAT